MQAEEHELREFLLADLRGVYNSTEQARLTIKAHQSAAAYGEQMEILIGCQAVMLKFKRSLELRLTPDHRDRVDPGGRSLLQVIGYLRALQNEYTENYRDVEECQRYDQAVTQRRINELVAGDQPFDESQLKTSAHTWMLLQRPDQFPVLRTLIGCGEQYNESFAKPLYNVAAQLIPPKPGQTSSDPGFDVGKFDKRVEKAANDITDRVIEEGADRHGRPSSAR